jgi:hypothetical protein
MCPCTTGVLDLCCSPHVSTLGPFCSAAQTHATCCVLLFLRWAYPGAANAGVPKEKASLIKNGSANGLNGNGSYANGNGVQANGNGVYANGTANGKH